MPLARKIVTLISAFLVGALSFVLDLPIFGTEKLISHGPGISFMMQAWWVFCIFSVIFVIVSLFTPAPLTEQVDGQTWENPLPVIFGGKAHTAVAARIVAGAPLATMAVLRFISR